MPVGLGGKWKATVMQRTREHWKPVCRRESSSDTGSAVALPQRGVQLSLPVSCQQKHPLRSFYHQILLHFCTNQYIVPWLEQTCAVLAPLAPGTEVELRRRPDRRACSAVAIPAVAEEFLLWYWFQPMKIVTSRGEKIIQNKSL